MVAKNFFNVLLKACTCCPGCRKALLWLFYTSLLKHSFSLWSFVPLLQISFSPLSPFLPLNLIISEGNCPVQMSPSPGLNYIPLLSNSPVLACSSPSQWARCFQLFWGCRCVKHPLVDAARLWLAANSCCHDCGRYFTQKGWKDSKKCAWCDSTAWYHVYSDFQFGYQYGLMLVFYNSSFDRVSGHKATYRYLLVCY